MPSLSLLPCHSLPHIDGRMKTAIDMQTEIEAAGGLHAGLQSGPAPRAKDDKGPVARGPWAASGPVDCSAREPAKSGSRGALVDGSGSTLAWPLVKHAASQALSTVHSSTVPLRAPRRTWLWSVRPCQSLASSSLAKGRPKREKALLLQVAISVPRMVGLHADVGS